MKLSRFSDSQIKSVLKQVEQGIPVPELCRDHGTSSATFYKWRAKFGGMDASLMARMKELEAVETRQASIRLACRAFVISETCYHCQPHLDADDAKIADWLNHYAFESVNEVQDQATRWLWTYNNEQPNMALGGITPNQKLAMAA